MAGSLAGQYAAKETFRDPYLREARDNSAITIPALIPPEDNGVQRTKKSIKKPADSIGARGVNNLASKLLIGLLPSNAPIFRLIINDMTVKRQLAQANGTSEVQKALGQVERAGMQEVDGSGVRGPAYVMLQHLLVAGNYLVYIDNTTGEMRGYPLHSYVVTRDRMGNHLQTIVKEEVAFAALSKDVQELVLKDERKEGEDKPSPDDNVQVYTGIERIDTNRFRVWQEVEGQVVPGSEGFYTDETCPWLPLRLITVDGEDYGRAFVTDLYGDLFNANELRRAIVTYSRAASKVIYLVKPNATTKPKALRDALSGDFVVGNLDDIKTLTIDKAQDFNVARAVYEDIKRALELSFLLNSTVQRQAERVTAEEVRAVIEELNTGLGGIQSLLANEFQLPFVRLLLARMQRQKLFKLPKGIVKPTIVTGIAALGRSQDLQNFVMALNALSALNAVPPEFRQRIKPMDFLNRVFTAAGVDMDGLLLTDDEVAAIQQQQQMDQMAQGAAPGALQQVAKGIMDQQTQQVKAEAAPAQ